MLNNLPVEFQHYAHNCSSLKNVLIDTQHGLTDIRNNHLLNREIKENLFGPKLKLIISLEHNLEQSPVVLVFGQNCHAKALFVNTILDESILPQFGSNWRWIKIKYASHKGIRLTLGQEYEIVEKLKAYEEAWLTIPEDDLQRSEPESPLDHCPTIEVDLCNTLLKDDVIFIIPPDCNVDQFNDILMKNLDNYFPIIIYAIGGDILSDLDIQEIHILREKYQDLPILFVTVSKNESISRESLTESEQHFVEKLDERMKKLNNIQNQLKRIGLLIEPNNNSETPKPFCIECTVDNNLLCDSQLNDKFVPYVQEVLKSNLLKMSAILSEIHNTCLRTFILSAFDMAREIQITPKRILYSEEIEMKLYRSLMAIACQKQEEITKIIQRTLVHMKSNIEEVLDGYQSSVLVNADQQSANTITMEIHQLVLKRLSNSVAKELVQSVTCLQDSFTGTLQRCLQSLEKNCLEFEGNLPASDAVKQILSAAYNIDLKPSTKLSLVHTFMEKLKTFVYVHVSFPWAHSAPRQFDSQWQIQIVNDLLQSLCASKLAKIISTQFQEHVRSSHDAFQTAMRYLKHQLEDKLGQTQEQRIAIRKRHAPRFARLALESTSQCDFMRWGMPRLTKEIGRGQYGVVFSCEPMGGISPCAIKSVVPPDGRHWNDLAMEFYYTRTIPEHPRIVKLRGSIIDHSYGGGGSSAVLLIMERMTRDLHSGLRTGLPWTKRIQIAIDVVEGIRYLHSQGLVHRDIKLKNVLLDCHDRAKLTDFGFCIPEAMISGSVVGTPVHMAPELLTGHYDSSVDVYAFGILFWYICAGQVKLPYHFEHFRNKEQLWTSVKKGMRPERLSEFSNSCWQLMRQCWSAEPLDRPLLGYVQPQLELIQRETLENSGKFHHATRIHPYSDNSSLSTDNYSHIQTIGKPEISVSYYDALSVLREY